MLLTSRNNLYLTKEINAQVLVYTDSLQNGKTDGQMIINRHFGSQSKSLIFRVNQ